MKYHFIFLTVFIFSKITPSYADNYIPYLNLTNKAEWLYDQGEYLEAKECFKDAFKLVEKIKFKDIVVYSKILSQQNEQKQIYRLLKKYLKQNGGTIRPISISLKRGDIVLSEKRLRELDKYTVDTTSDQYQSELELTNQFKKLYELDVLVRMKNN